MNFGNKKRDTRPPLDLFYLYANNFVFVHIPYSGGDHAVVLPNAGKKLPSKPPKLWTNLLASTPTTAFNTLMPHTVCGFAICGAP